jgi:hypothetical protein
LTPNRLGLEFLVGGQACEFGAGSRAARRTIVRTARA